jgi:hypothetical protein
LPLVSGSWDLTNSAPATATQPKQKYTCGGRQHMYIYTCIYIYIYMYIS